MDRRTFRSVGFACLTFSLGKILLEDCQSTVQRQNRESSHWTGLASSKVSFVAVIAEDWILPGLGA